MKKKLANFNLGSIKDLSRAKQRKIVAGYGGGGGGGGGSNCNSHPCPDACNNVGWANYAWSVWGKCCTSYGCWW